MIGYSKIWLIQRILILKVTFLRVVLQGLGKALLWQTLTLLVGDSRSYFFSPVSKISLIGIEFVILTKWVSTTRLQQHSQVLTVQKGWNWLYSTRHLIIACQSSTPNLSQKVKQSVSPTLVELARFGDVNSIHRALWLAQRDKRHGAILILKQTVLALQSQAMQN